GGPGVRLDSAAYAGYRVPPYYDSMIGKLIVHGRTRRECVTRLRRALSEMVVGGIDTTLDLHRDLVNNEDIIEGRYDIHWLERYLEQRSENA
ncbi:MAG: acetyl-CoA carboxylase biotin carboxylase subunit, partial [Pseudomonadota bacterium]